MQKQRNQKMATMRGFTIIEVVLVLAIAGLIFLMVFVALPSMQRSQRDTQRREDMARFMTAIQNYQANNSNKLPDLSTEATSFMNNYLKQDAGEFVDPSGNDYVISVTTFGENPTVGIDLSSEDWDGKTIHYVPGGKCAGEGKAAKATGSRSYAILYKLEGSGTYCSDNS